MVSFRTITSSAISEGTIKRSPCGNTIRKNTAARRIPSESAASVCPAGTAFTPERSTSATTPAAERDTGSTIFQKLGSFSPNCGATRKKK